VTDEHEHLTTGWEPDVPIGDTLLRRFVLTWADHLGTVAAAAGGRVERSDAALFTDAGTNCIFDNAVMLLRPPVEFDLEGELAAADAFFPGERTWLLLSPWPMPPRTGPGWAPVGHPPFMLRPAGGSAPSVPDGLRIVEVDDDAGVADYATVVREGYPLDDAGVIGDPRAHVPALKMFVGYEGDRPVSAAAAWIGDGIAEVTLVASLPDVRGRGYGEAVTWQATLAEPALPAGLCASDLGRPIYERMGYLPVTRFTLWMRLPR